MVSILSSGGVASNSSTLLVMALLLVPPIFPSLPNAFVLPTNNIMATTKRYRTGRPPTLLTMDDDPNAIFQNMRGEIAELKKQINHLTVQYEKTRGDIAELKNKMRGDIAELKNENAVQDEKIAGLKKEIGGIRGALFPATLWSLMEEAVYLSINETKSLISLDLPESKLENLKYHSAKASGELINALLDEDQSRAVNVSFGLSKADKKNLSGAGVSTLKHAVCYGTAAFLQNVGEETFEDHWPPERDPLQHNGKFLDCLYDRGSGAKTLLTEEQVKILRGKIKGSLRDKKEPKILAAQSVINALDKHPMLKTTWNATNVESCLCHLELHGP